MMLAPKRAAPSQALREQRRSARPHNSQNTVSRGIKTNFMQLPRWTPDQAMQIRSDEWKRRALRNHFPETWVRNTNWVPSLEAYTVDPEFQWQYYQQAHRQLLYNHPEDYTNFIDEVLEHVELRPETWVPRCLRVFEDLKERYGASQRQYTTLIQVYGRARFLKKAEEAFNEVRTKNMPHCKDNYLALARAYVLSRHIIGDIEAEAKCRQIFEDGTKKGVFMPFHITNINFEKFYDSLLRLGSELDYKERKKQADEGNAPLALKSWDNKSLWHNIKPNQRLPREWALYGHPLNRDEFTYFDWTGVKKGEPFWHQNWKTYGYPNQIRWIEKWEEFRKQGKWTEWDGKRWLAKQQPRLPSEDQNTAKAAS
ncbi:hypothetical protein DIPPA_12485 [Diplonema papillatum]|nr:hypothetical protein DIPPA_19572 [Diplonema papillatum]KAJ9456294.1 hypothetical protein DIPPA_12485 [Diplonema papillatum]